MTRPVIGILMLKTRFPRVLGDIGNPQTWPFPVRYEVIELARVDRVVSTRLAPELFDEFVFAGERLVAAGVTAITTSCGFLSLLQDELTCRLATPVITSSLMQIPLLERMLPQNKRLGVITINAAKLTTAHLAAIGARIDTPVEGVENGKELAPVIFNDLTKLDLAAAESDVLAAGDRLIAKIPDLGAVVLECTNMAPYSHALRQHLQLPVYDIVSLINWLYAGLPPHD